MLGSPDGIIVDDGHGVQRHQTLGRSGLGVGGHPEGIVLGIQVLTLCRAHEVDELLGVFLLVSGTALDQGHGTHLIAGAVGGEGQLDGIALGGGLQTVVREGQGNGRLAQGHAVGSGGTGLGVLGHVLVQLLQVIPHGILTLQLDQRGQNGVGGAGGGGVGHNDHILILGIQQVIPAGGIIIPFVREPVLVAGEGDGAHIDGVPHAVGVQIVLRGVGQLGGLIGLQQALAGGGDVVIGGAAEHQGGLGIVLLSSHAGQHLTGGEPQSVDLDAGGLLKRVEVVGHLGLGECRVDGQLVAAAGLPAVPFGGGVTVAAAAGGEHSQRHGQGKEQRE